MRARFLMFVTAIAAAVLVLAASAGAIESRMTVTEQFFNPCTNETFVAEGTMTVRSELVVGSDGRVHERWHVNYHAGTAKGVVTGAKYVVQEQTNAGTNSDIDAAPSTTHFIYRKHYVRSGEGGALIEEDDFYIYTHLHLTINSNGVPTSVKVDSEEEPCR